MTLFHYFIYFIIIFFSYLPRHAAAMLLRPFSFFFDMPSPVAAIY
jgi:hypothetical protein